MQVQIQLPGGLGVSLVNATPEELAYISLRNIDLSYSSNPHGQALEANVAAIQARVAPNSIWGAMPLSFPSCKV